MPDRVLKKAFTITIANLLRISFVSVHQIGGLTRSWYEPDQKKVTGKPHLFKVHPRVKTGS